VITLEGDEDTCVAYIQARHHLPNDMSGSNQVMYGYYTTGSSELLPDGRFAHAS
jgi:hypothetical protein